MCGENSSEKLLKSKDNYKKSKEILSQNIICNDKDKKH